MRTIELCSASNKNFEIIQSIFGQMSDGIWENSNHNCCYWMAAHPEVRGDKIVVDIDTVSYLDCGYNAWSNRSIFYYNRYNNMTDAQIMQFFANKISQIVHIEHKDNQFDCPTGAYRLCADNDYVSDYFGYKERITMSDLFHVRREILANAKGV